MGQAQVTLSSSGASPRDSRYAVEIDEPSLPTENKEIPKPSNDRPILSVGKVKIESHQSENTKNRVQDEGSKLLTPHTGEKLNHAGQTTRAFSENIHFFPPVVAPSPEVTPAEERAIYDHNVDALDDEEPEDIESEQLNTDELFEIDNEEQDDGLFSGLFPHHPPSDFDEERQELSWDDFESLEKFDTFAHQEPVEEVQRGGKIAREHRAWQIAVEVLDKTDWDQLYIELLQQIFIENGWSATRAAIERGIAKGLSPDQLALAWEIKQVWGEISWVDSLLIINCFSSLPDIEEVCVFLDGAFYQWSNSDSLRRNYKFFSKYLKYRTGFLDQALLGDCMFSFQNPIDSDFSGGSDSLYISNTPERQVLLELGVQSIPWPRPPENKMKIIKGLIK